MKFNLEPQFSTASGGSAGSGLVFYTKDGVVLARAKGNSRGSPTPQRSACRARFAYASKAWALLTPEQRAAWAAYAQAWFRATPQGERLHVNAQNVFTKANSIRQVLGLPMIADAPLLGPPSPPVEATIELSAAPDEFSFCVHHGYENVAGYSLLVRITPATDTGACTPRTRDAVYVCGVGPASTAPLGPSGGVVTFAGARLSVNDGKRFGFEIRIARQCDGMPSPPLWRDTIRRVG